MNVSKRFSMLAGLEPTRDKPKRFRIVHLNHSVTAPLPNVRFSYVYKDQKFSYECYVDCLAMKDIGNLDLPQSRERI
jgi:hypothetical protein